MSPTNTVFPSKRQFSYSFKRLPEYLETLRDKLRIAVIHGGNKDNTDAVIYKTYNPRSTKTYELVSWDIANVLIESGFKNVLVIADDMNLTRKLKAENVHMAWLNTGGTQGYNPLCHTPALLEMLGIPYVGHDPLNVSILDNKHIFKREIQALGIPTAPFLTWHPSQGVINPTTNNTFIHTFGDYSGPFIVKPVSGRASLNVSVVNTVEELSHAVASLHEVTRNTALVEAYLPGREFCVSVCGPVTFQEQSFYKNPEPFAFSLLERCLAEDEPIFTSMDKKSISVDRVRLLGDHELEIQKDLREIARTVYCSLGIKTLIRLDIRADLEGKLHVLEANPKPDLKRPHQNVTSLVAQGLSKHEMTYEDLILSILCDRLDSLLTYDQAIIPHIMRLLE